MLISKKHNFVFVHNPKAGGTAIRSILKKYCEEPNRFWHQSKATLSWEKRIFDLAHLSIRDAIDYGFVQKAEVETIGNWLACVREPISRFLSAFDEHCRQHGRQGVEVNDFIEREMSFDSIEYDWRYVHFRSQVEMIRVPYNANYFIMHHETFKDNWRTACEQIFGELYNEEDFALPTVRMRPDSSNKPTADMLTDASVQKLCLLYLEDYMTFLYKFPVREIKLPKEHWARMEIIHRDAHRNTILYGPGTLYENKNRTANQDALTIGERMAFDKVIEKGGWNSGFLPVEEIVKKDGYLNG
jgi:hypothetical protein